MVRTLLLALAIGYATANICTNEQGHWSFGISGGVTDFAYTGVNLNKSYYCFEGCLITADVVQNYKVLLSGNNGGTPMPKMNANVAPVQSKIDVIEKSMTYKERVKKVRDDDDPNAFGCVDPALRAQIGSILNGLTSFTAKNIARTLQYQLNRPGWCINVVKTNGGALDGIFQDFNFCDYDAMIQNELTIIRMAAIDFS